MWSAGGLGGGYGSLASGSGANYSNTGGGGAGTNAQTGWLGSNNGNSGVVIVRYAA